MKRIYISFWPDIRVMPTDHELDQDPKTSSWFDAEASHGLADLFEFLRYNLAARDAVNTLIMEAYKYGRVKKS
ncbi:MAG: hypothetical protein ACOZBH_00850 [Patescibacteria group bacterium]